jgi:excisionase family DNA binding protein
LGLRCENSHETIWLPTKAISLLSKIRSNMAAAKSMALILSDADIGTQEAADFLDMSRPYVVRLLENGEIPFSKVGTHRRIQVSDLLAYQKKMKSTWRKQLNFLARQAQELNLGYSNEVDPAKQIKGSPARPHNSPRFFNSSLNNSGVRKWIPINPSSRAGRTFRILSST